MYLARFMVSAFLDYSRPGFDETVEDILSEWRRMQEQGAWLRRGGDTGLEYNCLPGSPGDLFAQICALDLPAEFRLQLYGVLHRFPEALAELMRPVALRLAIALMDPNRIHFNTDRESGIRREYRYLYIGCGISASSLLQEHSIAMDEISSVLRGLSERKRLEALRQLAKKRLYGQELAELLNMDRGNLSRLLAVLSEQGFICQEKENQRIYYRADRDSMQNFFDSIIAVLFD